MNILHINKNDLLGGAAKIAKQLVDGQRALGHEVSFFVACKQTIFDFIHEIKPNKLAVVASHLLGTDLDFFASDKILKTKEYQQADIVHFHNIHGHYFNWGTFQKICNQKSVVWTLHDLWAMTPYCCYAPYQSLQDGFYSCTYNSSNSKIKFFNQVYLRNRKRQAYAELNFNIVAPSSYWLNDKIKSSIISNKSSRLIYHGINTNAFQSRDKKTSRITLGLPLDKKIVLWVSTGGKKNIWKGWQDVERVIKTFEKDSNVIFVCLGNTEFIVNKNGIINRDHVKNEEEMSKYYSAADVLLLASKDESFGLVVVEALCCGLPVVGYQVGIIPDVVINGQTGYMVKSGDWRGLVQGLREITNGDKLISINHNLFRQRFSLNKMVDEYIEYYQYILNNEN